ALALLDPDSPAYSLDVVSVVESVLEDPRPLLFAQQRAARGEAVAAMKAEGMEYEERMAALEEVTWPRPLAEMLEPAFATYVRSNPWVGDLEISPKSVVREMVENAMTFTELVSRYDVGRSEGVVLRYLTDAYRALRQVVPEEAQTPEVRAIISWLAGLIRAVDSSLLDEWEALASGRVEEARSSDEDGSGGASGTELAFGADEEGTGSFSANRHAVRTAIRTAVFHRVELMSRDDVAALARLDGPSGWDEQRWDQALARYWAEHDWIGIDQRARSASLCRIAESPSREEMLAVGVPAEVVDALEDAAGERRGAFWLVEQTILDPDDDLDWRLVALVDVPESDRRGAVALRIVTLAPR
ncbi:MAG: DUF3516 domain-containing protein, partial [Actinomyces sp.]|nr:DUF3516 domain-containing protein [Actinomyces sp.]